MLKNIFIFILLFIQTLYSNSLNLTKDEKNFLKNHPTIIVHMEENYAPFSFRDKDGKLSGFSIEYANLIAKKLGIKFVYSKESWNDAIKKLKKAEIDIIAQMVNTKERHKFAVFPQDYMTYFQSIVVKKDSSNLDSLDKLKGKSVGVVKGYVTAEPLKKYYPQIALKMYPNTGSLVDAVITGKIDAAISTHQVVQYDIISRFITDVVSIPMLNNPYMPIVKETFGVRKDWGIFKNILNKTMDSLNKEKRELQIKWFGANQSDENNTLRLTSSQLEYLKEKAKLNICMDPAWMPFSSLKNGEANGMASDFLKYFSKFLKVDLKTVKAKNWTEVLNKAQNKKCDMIILLKKTKEREQYLNFSKPVISVPYVVATTKDKFFIDDFKDVKDKKFSAIKGSAVFDDLKSLYPNINLIAVDSIQDGLNLVSNGEVYGYIDATAPIAYGVEKYGFLDLKVTGKLPLAYDLSIGVQKDESSLFEIVNEIVKTIDKKDSERIYNKWVTMQTQKVVDYSLVWQIVIATFIVIFLLAYRYRVLSKHNKLLQEAQAKIESQNKILEHLATTDKLTNIYNRAKLDELFQKEIDRSLRFGHEFTFCILDIDHFKTINDTHGHQVGDKVLIQLAEVLKQNIRRTDYVGRWGGEEFVVICPETDTNGAKMIFKHLQTKIQNYNFEKNIHMTASFGVTVFDKKDNSDAIIKRADEALYKAKNSGRNTVVLG